MKKTMFITSVIMVVVMAIALTTSSLAWFSASGVNNVTTTAMTVKAQGTTSSGIAISHDGGETWANNVTLTETGSTGLNPLVPFTTAGAYTPGELTGDELQAEKDRVYNALLAALVGGEEDAFDLGDSDTYGYFGNVADDTSYAAKMIGAKIDSNKLFTSDVYRNGFYTDTVMIKNLATGASAATATFTVNINFKCKKEVIVAATEEVPEHTEQVVDVYNPLNRNTMFEGNQYAQDAVLCVAVLARINEFATDEAYYANANAAGEDATDWANWEIIGYAESKGNTEISLGKTYEEFSVGATAASSFYNVETNGVSKVITLNKANTEPLRPEREFSDKVLAPTSKTVKVIAWYDGATLNNNNSSNMDLYFDLEFVKVNSGS